MAARVKPPTVWRQVATDLRSHPLPSGGRRELRLPPSGDRWLLVFVATRSQAVDSAIDQPYSSIVFTPPDSTTICRLVGRTIVYLVRFDMIRFKQYPINVLWMAFWV